MASQVVKPENLGAEFDTSGTVEVDKIRLKLGAGLSILPDGTIISSEFIFPLGGQFLLDPNEMNGWGVQGPYDDVISNDWGNVGDTTPTRLVGGLVYPFDVKIKQFYAWHRNSNAAVHAWGWILLRQTKTEDTLDQSSVFILDEVGSGSLRDYGNNRNQLTNISLDHTIPAGETLGLAVAAPTAVATNYYVQVMSGYFLLERI